MSDIDDLLGITPTKKVVKDTKRKLSKSEENIVVDRQYNKCAICRKELKRSHTHFDHIKPHAKGGKTVPSNMQALCANCHADKTNVDRVKDTRKARAASNKSSKTSSPIDFGLGSFKMPKVDISDIYGTSTTKRKR